MPETAIVQCGHRQPLTEQALATLYRTPDNPDHWLRANFVASLDGAIAVQGVSGGLSSPPDQRILRLLRTQCDALLLGAGTLRAEGYGPLVLSEPERAWRRAHGLPPDPTLVVVSGQLRLDPAAEVFTAAPVRPVVLTHAGAPAEAQAALARVADILPAGDGTVDLTAGLGALHRRGLRQVLCEGGPRLFGELAAADLVDELCLTVAPLLAGAGSGRLTAGPPHPSRSLTLVHALTAGDTMFLRYQRSPRVGAVP